MFRTLITTALLALPGLSLAATGLSWQWEPGEQERYVINSQTQTSNVIWVFAQDNIERRIDEWRLNIVTTCEATEAIGKASFMVDCTIDDLAIAMKPTKGDLENIDKLIEEYDEKLTGAKVRIKWASDGRFQAIDLVDVKHNRSNDRTRRVQEMMRILLVRAYSGLELQLPKKGEDKGKPWPMRDPQIMGFPTLKGTTGGLEMNGSITREKEGKVVVEASGSGTRGPSEIDQRGQLMNLWDMKVFSKSTFDTADGSLVKSEAIAQGDITPSSQLARGGTVGPYIQAVNVERVALDAELEPLPANTVLDRTGEPVSE